MSKNAFRRPQVKQKTATPSPAKTKTKHSSDVSSAGEEDKGMQGKLLEEVEFGTKAKKSTSKPKLTTTATKTKTASEKKKPARPSLPSLEEEIKVSDPDPVEKKTTKKVDMKRVGSFDVEHAKSKGSARPPVVYKNRKSSNGKAQPKSSAESDDENDGDKASLADVGSDDDVKEVTPKRSTRLPAKASEAGSDSEDEQVQAKSKRPTRLPVKSSPADSDSDNEVPAKSKVSGRVPVIELNKKQSTTPVSPKSKSKQLPSSSPQTKLKRESHDAEPADSSDHEEDQPAQTQKKSHVQQASAAGSHRPARTAKSQGSKRLSELAAYNLDAVEAEEGGSARVLLDGLEVESSKDTNGSKISRTESEEPVSKVDADAMDVDEVPKSTPVSRTSASNRRKSAEFPSPSADDRKAKRQKVDEPSTPATDSAKAKTAPPARPASNKRKTATARPKTAAASTVRAKKTNDVGPSTPDLESDQAVPTYDKNLILRVIVAKLESSNTCDWYELSVRLNKEGVGAGMAKKGKKGEQAKITGDQLHVLYHNVVLPALKSGKPLWKDDVFSAPSPDSEAIVTPQLDDLDLPDDLESEEEKIVPASTKSKPTKAKN